MATTEEIRKQNSKFMVIYFGFIVGIAAAYFLGYAGYVSQDTGIDIVDSMKEVVARIKDMQIFYPINQTACLGFLAGAGIGAASAFLLKLDNDKNYAYKRDESSGTGGFMSEKEKQDYNRQYQIAPEPTDVSQPSENMIMSYTFRRPINSRLIRGNNNVVVIGGAGTGKTRFFVKPNILQMNASYVVTDPSGEILNSLGKVLKDNGYKIKIFNLSNMAHSNCYNPLNYIRDEAGVNTLIECFITNTTTPGSGGDDFFPKAEKLLYSACIFYLRDFCNDESKKNFANIVNMVNASAVDENNASAMSKLDELFHTLPEKSLAKKYYTSFKQGAGKTLKSIIISCLTRLQPFMTPQVVNLTSTDNLELEKIGDEKTALFIITPQADQTYSFLASMLYSQLFETLYAKGEAQLAAGGSEQLKYPVRCIMDEFANIGEVPNFPQKLATMRKYNISATIILQDIAQIESMYKDDYKTIIGNCSSIVFLGSKEPNTLKYFEDLLGKKTIRIKSNSINKGNKSGSSNSFQQTGREVMTAEELGRLDPNLCIVCTYTLRPVLDKKYKYETHPRYHLTADADKGNAFQYRFISAYDNTKPIGMSNIMKAKQAAARIREEKNREALQKDCVASFPQKTDNCSVPGTTHQALNNIELDKQTETNAYINCHDAYLDMAMQHLNDPVMVMKVEHVPCKYLAKLARQLSAEFHKSNVAIFSDVEDNKGQLVGVAYADKDQALLKKCLDNKLTKLIRPTDGGDFLMTSIHKSRFEEYKDLVIQKYKELTTDAKPQSPLTASGGPSLGIVSGVTINVDDEPEPEKPTVQDESSAPADENAFSDLQEIGDAFADICW